MATHQSRGRGGPATGAVGPPSGGKIHEPGSYFVFSYLTKFNSFTNLELSSSVTC